MARLGDGVTASDALGVLLRHLDVNGVTLRFANGTTRDFFVDGFVRYLSVQAQEMVGLLLAGARSTSDPDGSPTEPMRED
jgi:hypothetical protein